MASEVYDCPIKPPPEASPPTPLPDNSNDPVVKMIQEMQDQGVNDIDSAIANQGFPGAYEVFKCNCALDNLNQPFYHYEIPQNVNISVANKCAGDRTYFERSLESLPSIYKTSRSFDWIKQESKNQNSPPPFAKACMSYVMNLAETSYARCEGQSSTPIKGAAKPCVSPLYVNSIYNLFSDVFSCLGIPQQEMVAKMMVESSFHANTFVPIRPAENVAILKSLNEGEPDTVKIVRWITKKDDTGKPLVDSDTLQPILRYFFSDPVENGKRNYTMVGGDSGVGQLTGDAIDEVNKNLEQSLSKIRNSSHPACRRLMQVSRHLGKHDPVGTDLNVNLKAIRFSRNSKGVYYPIEKDDKGYPKPRTEDSAKDNVTLSGRAKIGNRCELISPPDGLVKNILYTAIHAENIANDVKRHIKAKGALPIIYELFGGNDPSYTQRFSNLNKRKKKIKGKYDRMLAEMLDEYNQSSAEQLALVKKDLERQKSAELRDINKAIEDLSVEIEKPIDALGIFKLKDLYKIMAVQAYNAGAAGASSDLVTFLQARYDAFKRDGSVGRLTLDDFNFWTVSSQFRDYQCPYVSNFDDKRDPCLKVFDATKNGFPQFLRACQKGGGRGYAAVVAHRVKKINRVLKEGTCSPKSFLTLCGENRDVTCDEKGNCSCKE